MRSSSILIMALLFMLAATMAFAQPCPTQCPVACPEVCPQACPQVQLCPQQCPCPAINPAAIGAGPAPDLAGLSCGEFDKAYMQSMFNQNNSLIVLTTYGVQRVANETLRDISGEIQNNVTGENSYLAPIYAGMECGTIPVDFNRPPMIINSLSESTDRCFDIAYTQTLVGVLQQARDANALAVNRSTMPQMRDLARAAVAREDCEIMRLQRWLREHGVCP